MFYYLPAMERKCGAKRTFISHLLMCGFAVLLMSLLNFTHSPVFFSVWSLFNRFINGLGDAGISYQYRTLAKRLLPAHFALMNELTVATFILACGIRLLISAPISAYFGFHVTCFILLAFTLLVSFYVWYTLPLNPLLA